MNNKLKLALSGVGVALAGGILSVSLYKSLETPIAVTHSYQQSIDSHFINDEYGAERPSSFEVAAEMSLNAVVHVKTETEMKQQSVDPMYYLFYGKPKQRSPQLVHSSGSGVIISADGYIVTNNHVIDRAKKIEVTLNDKKTYTAKVIGTDPDTDLALLKIDEDDLPFIQYGNSNEVHVGEWVLAVGNPFNLTSTVTAGIISAKGRDINLLNNDPYTGLSAIESFIQTDAAVNPGNSGGALVNTSGQLVGINSAIKSNTGSYTGYSFAIPVNIVKKVVTDLKEFGTVQRAFIGVNIREIDKELAEEIGTSDLNGVYILDVTENGAAAKSGIKTGDIIKKVGTKEVNDVPELQEQISQFRPGDKVIVIISRDNKEIKIPLVLKNYKGQLAVITNNDNAVLKTLGAKFTEVKQRELKELKLEGGIKVAELYTGKLRSANVRKGFIITRVNSEKVTTVDDLIEILSKRKGGVLIEGIYENGKQEFYGFGM